VDDGVIELSAQTVWPREVSGGFWPLSVEVQNLSRKEQEVELKVHAGGLNSVLLSRQLSLPPNGSETMEVLLPGWSESPSASLMLSRGTAPLLRSSTIGPRAKGASCIVTSFLELNSPCTLVAPEDLPQSYAAYTSLSAVVLDFRGSWPIAKLEPLATWVRQGGELLVVDPESALARTDIFGPWLEGRFQNDDSFLMGLGSIHFLKNTSDNESIGLEIGYRFNELERNSFPYTPEHVLGIPGIDKPPIGSFSCLLLTTLLALGPLNYFLVRKLQRPESWLLTTPALSLTATALVGSYGAIQGGFEVLASTEVLAVLDQRLHTMDIRELRTTWSGSSPPAWLTLADGTWHMPIGTGDNTDYKLDLNGGRKLEGAFMGVRLLESHHILHSFASRARLQIEGETVTNNLGADLDSLLYQTQDGTWYHAENLKDGATGNLVITTSSALSSMYIEPDFGRLLPNRLPEGCYLATLSSTALVPQDGLQLNYKTVKMLLVGILEE
jgi:hypothetical protein